MVIPKKGRRLGGSSSHQKVIIKNLAISLFDSGKIKTTSAKAKILRGFREIYHQEDSVSS